VFFEGQKVEVWFPTRLTGKGRLLETLLLERKVMLCSPGLITSNGAGDPIRVGTQRPWLTRLSRGGLCMIKKARKPSLSLFSLKCY